MDTVSVWTLGIELCLSAQSEGLLFIRRQSTYHFSHCPDRYLLLGNKSFLEVGGLTQALVNTFLVPLETKTAIWIFEIRGYCTQCVLIFIFILTGSCKNTWDGRY